MRNLFGFSLPDTFKTIFGAIFLAFSLGFLFSCETDIDLDLPEGKPAIVVEGHIEPSQSPVIVLTKSAAIFSGFSTAQMENSFVHHAKIFVIAGNQEFELQEMSSFNVSAETLQLIAGQYGLTINPVTGKLPFNFYFYTSPELKGEPGKNYRLRIQTENEMLTAATSIPQLNPLDSLWFKPHPNPKNDSLVMLWYRYKDPDTLGNCVRYFTKRNQETFYPGYFASVFIDEFVNGKPFIDFPLQRGEPKSKEPDFATFGYFKKGDTITVKWSATDLAHYRFWNSLETEFSSQGNPIGSPTVIQSNINGGLGIWGGYGSTYHKIVVPK
jgi:hypothetical protein